MTERHKRYAWFVPISVFTFILLLNMRPVVASAADTHTLLMRLGTNRGICIVLGADDPQFPIELAEASELLIYVQSADPEAVAATRGAADEVRMLGTRIYVEHGGLDHLHLASNLADGVIVRQTAETRDIPESEILRVLHPNAIAILGSNTITKPQPAGTDDWSHPYHGPDNNPQSKDQLARAPFLTQFLSEPWYVPMPQVTVASGGRLFKTFGHIAMKEREWPWINTLLALNAYNGTQLWQRALKPGFMIHRNTLIATPDTVYLADDESCKLLDSATGKLKDEIVIPAETDPDGVWKWMALEDGVLYALVGQSEKSETVLRGRRTAPGWPWVGLGKGYAREYAWGFGRTLLAIDLQTKEIVWTYKSEVPIDGRAMCMVDGRIYVYSHKNFLARVNAQDGNVDWKSSDPDLILALGEHDFAQIHTKGFASTSYVKANASGVYFAGPQRKSLVAVTPYSGQVMWTYPHGNYQLVLRDDGLYAMGRTETSKVFEFTTGAVIADLECYRGNCTRATGTVDSIFTRGYRHTGTMRLDLSGAQAETRRIPLMRPACQDGVIVSNGQLYFGPWMCDCNHSLVGMISLAPAGDFDFAQEATAERLELVADELKNVDQDNSAADGWRSYRGGMARQASVPISIPASVQPLWEFQGSGNAEPTAPIATGRLAFWGGLDGIVRACDVANGEIRWKFYTGGAVRFPPEVAAGRVYVGSGDGWVYCLEATTGHLLWRFRAAPVERKILVHGRLLSTWPVGSGVLVANGVVYAASGIASYDGTYVYALDALTGEIIWQNNTSGHLIAEGQVTGVSVQGHLLLHEDRLYLAGGNVVSPAIYDITNGKCLNTIESEWLRDPNSLSEKFPSRPQTTMFQRSPRGRELFLVDGEVRVFDQLLYSPPQYQRSVHHGGNFLQAANRETLIRATTGKVVRIAPGSVSADQSTSVWTYGGFSHPRALALGKNAVLVAGKQLPEKPQEKYLLSALRVEDGQVLWSESLSAEPVSWGLALDHGGHVVVTMKNGSVACFGP